METVRKEFATPEALAETLAEDVRSALAGALERRGSAVLAVSGGTTPTLFFQRLSRKSLDWGNVTVTLVDERFVPPSSERSNARLVTENLLQDQAAAARFVPLYRPVATVEAAAAIAAKDIAALKPPFDVMVLGMGADGHTASLFPDATDAATLLRPGAGPLVVPVHAPSAGEPRLTLPLATIAQSRFLVLHIEGDDKRRLFESALAGAPLPPLPIRAVIDAAKTPIAVYWSPSKEERS